MRPPREGAAQSASPPQNFLRRRLAAAIEAGDDLAAERLRQALDQALNGAEAAAPLPPPYPGWQFAPMSWHEAARWIASYNAWVEVWNRHETSRDLPLSPDRPEAEFVCTFSLPRSAMAFRPRGDGRLGVVRVAGWRPYHPGWSHCRNEAAVERVVWAGWHA